jgi:hypothetical protein
MLLSRLLPWTLGLSLALGVGTGVARAQNGAASLPPELMQLEGGASAQQQQTVRIFVSTHLTTIAGEDPAAAVASRDALLTALRAGSTNFKTLLGRQIVDQIDPLLASDQPLVRINALMLLQTVQELSSLNKLLPLLNDPHAGVQFAAVSAVQSLLLVPNLPPANRTRILSALDALARSKADPLVVERCLLAIFSDGSAGPVQQVLEVLEDRLVAHSADASMTYLPESKVFSQLLLLAGKQNPDEVRRRIVTIAASYHLLSLLTAEQRGQEAGSEELTILKSVAETTDLLLSTFADPPLPQASHPVPRGIRRLLFDADPVNWDQLITRARQWIDRLIEAGFPADQLKVRSLAAADENTPTPVAGE